MRTLTKLMLKAVAAICPVFIAACYGPSVNTGDPLYSLYGKVTRRDTTTAVEGIEVRCMVGVNLMDVVYSGPDGSYTTQSTEACTSLEAADVDGTKNGAYATKTVPVTSDKLEYAIELDPTP